MIRRHLATETWIQGSRNRSTWRLTERARADAVDFSGQVFVMRQAQSAWAREKRLLLARAGGVRCLERGLAFVQVEGEVRALEA
jgi:hypothetical protein